MKSKQVAVNATIPSQTRPLLVPLEKRPLPSLPLFYALPPLFNLVHKNLASSRVLFPANPHGHVSSPSPAVRSAEVLRLILAKLELKSCQQTAGSKERVAVRR